MTDQERIAKLRDGTWDHTIMRGPNPTGFCVDETPFARATADRIEELVKERDEERSKRRMAEGLAGLSSADIDGHSAMITVARDAVAKRMAAEAKLAKAVKSFRHLFGQWFIRDLQRDDFMAVLNEMGETK